MIPFVVAVGMHFPAPFAMSQMNKRISVQDKKCEWDGR